MQQATIQPRNYISGIDGLRAVAVLSVLVYHLSPRALPGGFVGVDIFFVISGFVISKSLAESNSSAFGSFILDFYRRRIVRLVPALAVFLLITTFLSVLFIPRGWLSDPNDKTALYAFFGLSNFYLVTTADGYFGARVAFNPFVHTWSLAVEEQFYLLFPATLYLWLKHRGSPTLLGTTARAILPVLVLSSLAFAAYETAAAHERAFYLLPSRFWELGAGALLYQWVTTTPSPAAKWLHSELVLWTGAALTIMSFCLTEELLFPFPWAVVPIIGTALMIFGVVRDSNSCTTLPGFLSLRRLLNLSGINYIGRISYSLYLWHWGVLTLFRWTVGLSTLPTMIAAVVLSFVLAALSYHYPESFFRSIPAVKNSKSRSVVTVGLCALAAAVFWTSNLFDYRYHFGLSVTEKWSEHRPLNAKDVLTSTDKASGKQLFVVGDSHAGAYRLMARTVAESVGAKAVVISVPGCPIARLTGAPDERPVCHGFVSRILEQLRGRGRPGDIVFLASLRVDRFGDQWALFNESHTSSSGAVQADRERSLAEASRLVEELQGTGFVVLFDAPKPIFKAPPFRCSDWFNKVNAICEPGFEVSREELLERRKPAMEALRILEEKHKILVWDPFPELCNRSVCSAFDGEAPIFYDGDHLTAYGNRLLVPSFARQIRKIWNVVEVPAGG